MKLFLSVEKPPINGYQSIDLATQAIDFNNMDTICEASECFEMILDEVLNFIDLQHIPGILTKLISRIRKNGRIIITGFDINEITKSYINGILSIADFNLVLFGTGRIKKISTFSHNDIQNIITSNGLKISSVDIIGGKFTIIAKREG
jgi:ABC-type enterochelin transport system ATPase subunit